MILFSSWIGHTTRHPGIRSYFPRNVNAVNETSATSLFLLHVVSAPRCFCSTLFLIHVFVPSSSIALVWSSAAQVLSGITPIARLIADPCAQ